VVVHVELDFKSSAVLGDVLVCSAKLVEIQNKTFRIAFEARTRGKNVLVASGYCVCAMQGQGRAIPLAEVKGLLEGLEIARSKRIRHHIASKL
jgi:acyl-CoA thioesterase FadM